MYTCGWAYLLDRLHLQVREHECGVDEPERDPGTAGA
jgi:hypothetical protein